MESDRSDVRAADLLPISTTFTYHQKHRRQVRDAVEPTPSDYGWLVTRRRANNAREALQQGSADAQLFFSGIEKKTLRSLALELHNHLIKDSVVDYVKTIYVGYEFKGEMFAALYRNTGAIEVALPLSEDDAGPLIMDASHLTWRTLPLMIQVTRSSQLPEAFATIDRAFDRLKSGLHHVHRSNEYFIARKKGRPMRE